MATERSEVLSGWAARRRRPTLPRRLEKVIGEGLTAAAVGLFFMLILLPLASLFLYAAQEGMSVFTNRLAAPEARQALWLTVLVAAATTAVNMVVGLALAFVLVRRNFWGRRVVDALVDIPLAIPTVVTGFALLLLYSPTGLLGWSLAERGLQVMFSFPGILLGHVFVTFPFMVRAVGAVLETVDTNCEDAARTLGARDWQVFRHVTLPAIHEGLWAGGVLTFARSLGEFGASIMVSGNLIGRTQTAPLYIYSRFNMGDIEGASAIAVVLGVASFIILFLLKVFTRRRQEAEEL